MKKYYLDTSTVRQYSNKLEKFKKKNIFTSILEIFELLSGVNNEKEFFLRKSVIKNLCKSNIQIDWSFYIEKMYPFEEAGKIQLIRRHGQLLEEEYVAEGISVKAYVTKEIYGKI